MIILPLLNVHLKVRVATKINVPPPVLYRIGFDAGGCFFADVERFFKISRAIAL